MSQYSTVAPLANVSICMTAMDKIINRQPHLPGLACFFGPSGFGKSHAAAYTADAKHAVYIECKSTWTRKNFLAAVIKELGLDVPKTLGSMTEIICEELALSGRPMIIDEADHLVGKKAVEVVRDIYDASNTAILLIGEERLPHKLKKWERVHGRMLTFAAAQPASFEDAVSLRNLYCQVEVADDLLQKIHAMAKGSARRIGVNLAQIQEEAFNEGWSQVDLKKWGKRPLFTGDAPKLRAAL